MLTRIRDLMRVHLEQHKPIPSKLRIAADMDKLLLASMKEIAAPVIRRDGSYDKDSAFWHDLKTMHGSKGYGMAVTVDVNLPAGSMVVK